MYVVYRTMAHEVLFLFVLWNSKLFAVFWGRRIGGRQERNMKVEQADVDVRIKEEKKRVESWRLRQSQMELWENRSHFRTAWWWETENKWTDELLSLFKQPEKTDHGNQWSSFQVMYSTKQLIKNKTKKNSSIRSTAVCLLSITDIMPSFISVSARLRAQKLEERNSTFFFQGSGNSDYSTVVSHDIWSQYTE